MIKNDVEFTLSVLVGRLIKYVEWYNNNKGE